MDTPHNPSAFPLNAENQGRAGAFSPEPGMFLRDWFAGQFAAKVFGAASGDRYELVASDAYEMADAMLRERERRV